MIARALELQLPDGPVAPANAALVTSRPLPSLIIVAAGSGSRLWPLTRHIPKALVSLGDGPAIDRILERWRAHVGRILIIAQAGTGPILEGYCRRVHPRLPLEFRYHDRLDGSANALFSKLPTAFQKDVYVSWCDLFPADAAVFEIDRQEDVVFVSRDAACRYRASSSQGIELTADHSGDVVGLFYFRDLRALRPPDPSRELDLVELIDRFTTREVRVTDFGDREKLDRYLARRTPPRYQTRSFNRLEEVCPDALRKSALTDEGRKLLAREAVWYRKLGDRAFLPRVQVAADGSLLLERLDAQPLWQVFGQLDANARGRVLARIDEIFAELHSIRQPTAAPRVRRDASVEYIETTRKRLAEVAAIIPHFGRPRRVNGQAHVGHELLLERAARFLDVTLDARTAPALLHGDPQFSNILVDSELRIWLIDPRGYFGESELYGLPEYDVAKLHYALSGYDLFNVASGFAIDRLDGERIDFEMPVWRGAGATRPASQRLRVLVAIIWLKLTSYISNDVSKAIAAYSHGCALLQAALDA